MPVVLTIATTLLEEAGPVAGIAAAKKAGFAAIEIALADSTDRTLGNTREWAAAAQKEGLTVAGLATNLALHHEKSGAWDDARAAIERVIDLAAEIGAGYVRVFGHQVGRGESRSAVLTRIGTRLGQLGNYAATKKVLVLLQNAGSFVHSKELWQIIELSGCGAGRGICWDAAEASRHNESPVLSVPTLNTRLKAARFYDLADNKPVAPGKGHVKLKTFAERLRGLGFDGPVVLSAGVTAQDATTLDTALAESIHTIKDFFNLLPPPPPPPKPAAPAPKPAAAPTPTADSAPTPQVAPHAPAIPKSP